MELNDNATQLTEAEQGTTAVRAKKSFPALQLSIIWLIQFTEPVSNTVIYPFINQFVAETGITRGDEKKTGYYAGIIESAFFFAECLSVYHWGRLSDKVGRRPVLLFGPLGLTFAILFFGLSRNFWMLVASRCAQGIFNGNIGVTKSVMIEITDPADVPIAFGWIPAIWSIGITLGPIIGGALARPAVRWPEIFGPLRFFHEWPYFLPCASAGAVAFASYLYTYFFLEESLPSAIQRDIERKRAYSPPGETAPLLELNEAGQRFNEADFQPPPIRNFFTRKFIVALVCWGFIAFLDQSHGVLLPLMMSTSISLGGLDFSPYTIGMIMGTWGLLNAGFQVVFFPLMMKWLGPRKLSVVGFGCAFVTFGAFPVMNILAKQAGGADMKVWAVIVIQLFFYSIVFATYGSTQLFVLDAAPGKAATGAANGLAQMMSSVVRTMAPTIASSLFSLSIQRQLMGGYLVYTIIIGFAFAAMSTSLLLPPALDEH